MRPKKIFLIISLLIAAFGILSFRSYGLEETEDELKLYLDEIKILSVSNPTRIAIGNPKILDITKVTKDSITLSPKAVGKTTLVFWDDFGESSYQVKVFAEDMIRVKQRIDNLLEKLNLADVYTQAEEEENKIFLLGKVESTKDKERIDLLLGPLKQKTVDLIEIKEEAKMVEIDVQVLELSQDAGETLGFTWPSSTGTLTEPSRWSKLAQIPDSFLRITEWTRSALTAQIDFLVTEGKARILSRPRLACQSGKEAKLLVGGEVPTFTATISETGVTTGTVSYKEYGIILNMKPVVENSQIYLSLGVEVSELGTVETTSYGRAYPLTKRNAYTELILNDNETLVIGGLIKQKTSEDLRKMPWLADIPVLGTFFRKKSTSLGGGAGQRGDIELFITLTPNIITQKKQTPLLSKEEKKPSVESPPPLESQDLPAPLKNYIKIIQSKITSTIYYPQEARDAGWQGNLILSILLSSDGRLKDVLVSESSGYKILDEAGIKAVRSIVPFPPIPSELNLEELRIDIPIIYHKD